MHEMYLEYLEDLKKIENVDDDFFPDFLFTFISNEFENDNYYERGLADSPLLKEAKQIRRKYSDFFDFQDAIGAYTEYMELLADKYDYPNIKAVSRAAKEGLIEDYVPPKPRLKNTRKNRALSTAGMIPSRKVIEPVRGEELIEVARQMLPGTDGENTSDDDISTKPSKEIKKIFQEAYDRVEGINRRRNMYSRSGTNAEIDFILNFINETNRGNFSSRNSDGVDNRPLSEIVSDMKEEAMIPEDLRDYYLTPNTTILKSGRMRNARQEEEVEMMKLLYEAGLDVFNTYGKAMSKESVKMVRNAIGGGPLTKKEKKAIKKRNKEEQKRMANRRNNDAIMERALLRNRYSFDTHGNALSFTMSDLFRG